MLISVVVPFHNEEKHIRKCLEALLSASYRRDLFEIIAVDNNSTDRSAAIVNQYPRVRLLTEPKPGAYAARNRGVAASNGTIIAFTDSDCAPFADWLERIALAMSRPDVQLVQGSQCFARESLSLSVLSDYEAERAAYVFSSRAAELYYGYTNNMAIRRSVFDRVGPFVELQRGADTLFVHKVISAYSCEGVHYRPDIRIRHLEVTNSWQWFRKMGIYGRSFRGYSKMANSRPLSNRERLRVFLATVRRGKYSMAKSFLLMVLLAVGALYYELGLRYPSRIQAPTPSS